MIATSYLPRIFSEFRNIFGIPELFEPCLDSIGRSHATGVVRIPVVRWKPRRQRGIGSFWLGSSDWVVVSVVDVVGVVVDVHFAADFVCIANSIARRSGVSRGVDDF